MAWIKRLSLAAVVAAVAIGGAASASPERMYEIWYYSDATYTTEVGYTVFTCWPNYGQYGEQTAYYHIAEQDCPAAPYGFDPYY